MRGGIGFRNLGRDTGLELLEDLVDADLGRVCGRAGHLELIERIEGLGDLEASVFRRLQVNLLRKDARSAFLGGRHGRRSSQRVDLTQPLQKQRSAPAFAARL